MPAADVDACDKLHDRSDGAKREASANWGGIRQRMLMEELGKVSRKRQKSPDESASSRKFVSTSEQRAGKLAFC